MNILSAYREFIASPAQWMTCRETTSVEQLLQQLKYLWRQEALTDDQLLGELAACNRQIHDVDITALSGQWLPYCYQTKTHSICWCIPQGHAIEPFHDQYIERCRRLPLNQLITPRTSLESLLGGQIIHNLLQPAGFIFHLSRCGSTLVSGCLAEISNTCVLSESPLLTEIMLDDSLTEKEKQYLLPQLIHLQGCTSRSKYQVIIKWNAWDIFFWPLIRALYPKVPVVLLVRDPVEILASHQRSAGRHMAGEKSLSHLSPAFSIGVQENMLDLRINVLDQLINKMLQVTAGNHALVVDYAQLISMKIIDIARFFGVTVTAEEREHIGRRMQVHSKEHHRPFAGDVQQKRQSFHPDETTKINNYLRSNYQELINKKLKQRTANHAL